MMYTIISYDAVRTLTAGVVLILVGAVMLLVWCAWHLSEDNDRPPGVLVVLALLAVGISAGLIASSINAVGEGTAKVCPATPPTAEAPR